MDCGWLYFTSGLIFDKQQRFERKVTLSVVTCNSYKNYTFTEHVISFENPFVEQSLIRNRVKRSKPKNTRVGTLVTDLVVETTQPEVHRMTRKYRSFIPQFSTVFLLLSILVLRKIFCYQGTNSKSNMMLRTSFLQ